MIKERGELLVETFEDLPYKAKVLIFNEKNALEILDDIGITICSINSPIEKLYYVALIILLNKKDIFLYVDFQSEIQCNDKTYYADFTICYDEKLNDMLKENFNLIIECDGYNFHQKTKEQVDYDNKREYDLKMQGYEILRFSGRQIYNNPMECAEETLKFIIEKNTK